MLFRPIVLAAAVIAASLTATIVLAKDLKAREGWVVMQTTKSYGDLIGAVKAASKANGMGIVTQAGPTKMAAKRGFTIPGNQVIGVFNNDFAVKILATSTAAMIEAPIRIYVTENADGTATLAYKTPSHVFAPYLEEGGETLQTLASALDTRFAAIATAASE